MEHDIRHDDRDRAAGLGPYRGGVRPGPTDAVVGALLLVGLAAGVASDLWTGPAALVPVALAAAALTWRGASRPLWRRGAWAVTVLLALALAGHAVPGFAQPQWLPEIGPALDGHTVPLRVALDRGVAGLVLYLLLARHVVADDRAEAQAGDAVDRWGRPGGWRALARGAGVGLATAAVVIPVAYLGFGLAPDPKLPPWAGPWLVVQTAFVALPEEAFFRSLCHEPLRRAWQGWRYARIGPIVVTAVLFGVAHAGGGAALVLLALLAGIGYGWAYLRGGGVEAAIVAHVTLNAVHAFGFSYPWPTA